MRYISPFIKTLLLSLYFFLFSCRSGEADGSCRTKPFGGVLTINSIQYKTDEYHKRKILYVTFYADDSDSPNDLKPLKTQIMLEEYEFPDIKTNQEFNAKVTYVIGGTCPDEPILENPKNWREIRK